MTSVQEQAKLLLNQTKSERISALRRAFATDALGAYHLGIRLQLDSEDARAVLDSTLACSDASTIRWWLEFYAVVAGCRRLMHLLEELHASSDALYQKAIYWVPNLSSIRSQKDLEILAKWLERRRSA